MPENNQILSVEGQLIGMPTAGPESFSQQQLDYLKRALGVDETVLWSGTASAAVTCSESVSNFTRLRVYVKSPSFTTLHEVEFDVADSTVGYFFMANAQNGYGSQISATSTTVSTSGGRHVWFNDMSLGSESNSVYIIKVVGIHRIAGGN